MNWPLISIIITTYNYAHFLATSLNSALNQSYPHIEVLVLDNASTDHTDQVLRPYLNDARVRYYRHHTNIGASANHNFGLQLAQGEYIVFLSADDLLLPDFLLRSYLYLQQDQECEMVFSSMYFMNGHGQIQKHLQLTGEPIAAYRGYRNDFANLLAFSNYISFPSLLVPSRIYQQHGGFDETFIAIDFELVIRWAKAGIRFGFLPEALHIIRIHDRQESRADNFAATGRDIEDFLNILQLHLTPEHSLRVQGYEHNLIRTLHAKVQHALYLGATLPTHLQGRVNTTADDLLTLAAQNRFHTSEYQIGIIVFPGESLLELLSALNMLLEQSYPHWEAIVIQQPGMSVDALCRGLDPFHKRIHTAQLLQPTTMGRAINQAMILSSSNCMSFLHAGLTTYPPDHLTRLAAAMSDPQISIGISASKFYYNANPNCPVEVLHTEPDTSDGTKILTAPLYHLDTIVLKRHTIDEQYYFNEQYPIWTEWDMLMRLASHYPLEPIASTITQYSTLPDSMLFQSSQRTALAKLLYQAHAGPNTATQDRRASYIQHLQAIETYPRATPLTDEERIRIFQRLKGASLFEEQAWQRV